MKNTLIRIISLLIVCIMLVGLVACAKDDKTDETNNVNVGTGLSEFDPGLPEKRFEDGTTFTFAVRWMENNDTYDWNNTDIVSESLDGDRISQAVFGRNTYMKSQYNVDIEIMKAGECSNSSATGSPMATFIDTQYMSGDIEFDAILAAPGDTVGFAIRNMLVDLETVEYLNFEKSWWDQNSVEQLNFGDRRFMVAGDVTIIDNKATTAYAINRTMMETLDIPNIYDTVEDGTWTLAKMREYSAMAYDDVNNDSIIDQDDIIGVSYWQDAGYTFIISSGMSFAELNSDGQPEITVGNQDFIDAWDYIIDTITDKGFLNRANQADSTVSPFTQERALFNWATVASLMSYRSLGSDVDYGIIPAPKYNEDQEDYITAPAAYGFSVLSVPNASADELADTGYILEAFAAKSRETVLPEFYDVVLKYRTAEHPEDSAMLDVIFENIKYDIGNLMNFGGYCSEILGLFNKADKSINTWYAGNKTMIEAEVEKVSSLFR